VRPHPWQPKRRVRQRRCTGLPAIGRSRTLTTGRSLTSRLARPQCGQHAARATSSTSRSLLVAVLAHSHHLEAVQADETANVNSRPLFLLAPRSSDHAEPCEGSGCLLSVPHPRSFSKTPVFRRRLRPPEIGPPCLKVLPARDNGKGGPKQVKRQRHTPSRSFASCARQSRCSRRERQQGKAAKALEVSEQTLHRWRNQYDGMKART
jgi:hypothetical protein